MLPRHVSARLIALAIVGLAPLTSLPAQAPAPCGRELAWIAEYAATNYAGFTDKVNATTRRAYDSLLATLRADAERAAPGIGCDSVLGRWVAFFHDRHLSFTRRRPAPTSSTAGTATSTDAEIRARYATWERTNASEESVRAQLAALGADRRPLEGIWDSNDGRYRVAIARDARADRAYTMTVLRADSVWWTPGQMKATFAPDSVNGFRARFYMRDHSEQRWTARVTHNVLTFSGGGPWIRQWPQAADDLTGTALRSVTNGRFAAYEVAPGTVLVQIPTFNDPRGVDSLWAAEGARIANAERLIVDVRGNGGGSDYNFRQLLPLIYTNPVRSVGIMALSTDENIAANDALANDTTYPSGQRAGLKWQSDRMRKNRGAWTVFDDDVSRRDAVLAKPSRVAVLVDRGCASSCEQFLLAARQSTKVTLYGESSGGVLDYGNVRQADMPGSDLSVHRPITKSKRLPAEPIDNIGIPTNVRIPADEMFPVQWVIDHM